MAFCMNCGQQIPDGAKFCANCGTATGAVKSEATQRRTVYEGEIHKCPNCGEVLNSFISTCPACGYEIRNTRVSTSIREFAENVIKAESESKKITLIRNFPIPNAKEDIFEFMILASSNIGSSVDKRVNDAWLSKIEQGYQKGKLLCGKDSDFIEIQKAYDKAYAMISNKEQQEKKKSVMNLALRTIGLWGGLLIFLIAFIIDVVSVKMLRYSDTSIYHLGAAAVMIIGAYVVGKKFNGLACAGVGIVCGVIAMIMGSLLDSVFFGNGSMMMLAGGVVIVMCIVNLVKYSKK